MIAYLAIRNFQSIKSADFELGQFTVIVGPSSSGKSALIRAFRALASNVRGTSMITRGQKQMMIGAVLDTGVKVTLERGERSSGYRISGVGEHQFTKLAGEVPEQVTQILRLDPGPDSVNFAAQFDKPYLLDESGAAIARQLGELTNVNAIFEAVREANKIRANALSGLRTRKADLDQVRTQLAAFRDLSGHLKAFAEVELLDERRKTLQVTVGRLETAMRTLRIAERAMEKVVLADVPDDQQLTDAVARHRALAATLSDLKAKIDAERRAKLEFEAQDHSVAHLEFAFTTKLTQAGVCPTCGQDVHGLPVP